jgi:hypothetical protein
MSLEPRPLEWEWEREHCLDFVGMSSAVKGVRGQR